MSSLGAPDTSQGKCVSYIVSQVGEHMSLGIRVSQVGEHISLGIRVSLVEEHISLGIRVSQVGERISVEGFVFPRLVGSSQFC